MRLSILIFVFPSPPLLFAGKPTGNWLFSEPERGNNLNLTCGRFVFSNRMLVLYILIWRSLKVKCSLQRADGSQEMTDIKFSSLILPFKKNLAIESDAWVRHLNTLLARGGWGGGGSISANQSSNVRGGIKLPGGMPNWLIDSWNKRKWKKK